MKAARASGHSHTKGSCAYESQGQRHRRGLHDQTKTRGMAVGLGPLVTVSPHRKKEHLSLESANPKVQESQTQTKRVHDCDKQRDIAQSS